MNKLTLKKISVDDASQIINNIDSKEMCTTLNAVYVGKEKHEGVYYVTKHKIGEPSMYGKIYLACLGKKCNYIAKWQQDKEMAIMEATIQHNLSTFGITPNIREMWVCDKGVIIIMDALSNTAHRELFNFSRKQVEREQEYKHVFSDKIDEIVKVRKQTMEKSKLHEKLKFLINLKQKLFDPSTKYKDLYKLRDDVNKQVRLSIFNNDHKISELQQLSMIQDTDKQKVKRIAVVTQVFDLIHRLHKFGYTHMDTHTNNFMTDDNGVFYIIDFGLTKQSNSVDDRKYDYDRFTDDIRQFSDTFRYTNLDYLLTYSEKLSSEKLSSERN
tara:strand:- start:53 stop:1033 length:981 start_codon:yes stop_codon:yes gene_type:complete